jgi:hypothetical protein
LPFYSKYIENIPSEVLEDYFIAGSISITSYYAVPFLWYKVLPYICFKSKEAYIVNTFVYEPKNFEYIFELLESEDPSRAEIYLKCIFQNEISKEDFLRQANKSLDQSVSWYLRYSHNNPDFHEDANMLYVDLYKRHFDLITKVIKDENISEYTYWASNKSFMIHELLLKMQDPFLGSLLVLQ